MKVKPTFAHHGGFCHNSRRWLFRFIMVGTPAACKYREQGNTECVHEECGYYEGRPFITGSAAKSYIAWAGLASVKVGSENKP